MLDRKLEELLKSKKFVALDAKQKAFVLEKMTEEEYQNFRLVLCGTKRSLTRVRTAPSPRVKENLMAAMRAKKAKKRPLVVGWKRVVNYQIPAWQAAASLAFVLFSMFLIKQQVVIVESQAASPLMVTDTVFETIYRTDTVFEKIPVYLTGKKNVNVKPGKLEQDSNSLLTNSQNVDNEINTILGNNNRNRLLADSTPIYQNQIQPVSAPFLVSPPRGRTVEEDADLMQFLREVN